MNLQLISEALCLLGVVPFVEGGNLMSVEVVHDKDYFVRLRVAFDQIFYFFDSVCCRSVLSHTTRCHPPRGSTHPKMLQVPLRLYSESTFLSVLSRMGRSSRISPQQLIWLFIQAHHRTLRIIGSLIYIKCILHASYEYRAFFLRDAPVVVFV